MPLTTSAAVEVAKIILSDADMWQPDSLTAAHRALFTYFISRRYNTPIFTDDDTDKIKADYLLARRRYVLAAMHWQHSFLTDAGSKAGSVATFSAMSLLSQANTAIEALASDDTKSVVIACDIAELADVSDEDIAQLITLGEHAEIILISNQTDASCLTPEIQAKLAKFPAHWLRIFTGDVVAFSDILDFVRQGLKKRDVNKHFFLSSSPSELDIAENVYKIPHPSELENTEVVLPTIQDFDATKETGLVTASKFEPAQLEKIKTKLLEKVDEYISDESDALDILGQIKDLFEEIQNLLMLFDSATRETLIITTIEKFLQKIYELRSSAGGISASILLANISLILKVLPAEILAAFSAEEKAGLRVKMLDAIFQTIARLANTDEEKQTLAERLTEAIISDLLAEPCVINPDDKTVTLSSKTNDALLLCRRFCELLFKDWSAEKITTAMMGCVTVILRDERIRARYVIGNSNPATSVMETLPVEVALDFQCKVHAALSGITLADGSSVDLMPHTTKQQLDDLVETLVSQLGSSTVARLLFVDCDDTMMLADGSPNVENYRGWAIFLAKLRDEGVTPIFMTSRPKLYGAQEDDPIQALLTHTALSAQFAAKVFLTSATPKGLAMQYVWQRLQESIPDLSGSAGLFDDQEGEASYVRFAASEGCPFHCEVVTQHQAGTTVRLDNMPWVHTMDAHLEVCIRRSTAASSEAATPEDAPAFAGLADAAVKETEGSTAAMLRELATQQSAITGEKAVVIEEVKIDPEFEAWLDEQARASAAARREAAKASDKAAASFGSAAGIPYVEAPGLEAILEAEAAKQAAIRMAQLAKMATTSLASAEATGGGAEEVVVVAGSRMG